MNNLPEVGTLWISEKGAILEVEKITAFKRCESTISFRSIGGRIIIRRLSECKYMKQYFPPK